MQTIEKTVDILNDLIEINNDRMAGFEKALEDIKDDNFDLKQIFREYSLQSEKNSTELAALVAGAGDVDTGTSVSGTLHRAWIDVKSLFGGSDRESILAEAERGEDAIKKAYETALRDGDLSGEALYTVTMQAQDIYAAHNRIRALRDAAQ